MLTRIEIQPLLEQNADLAEIQIEREYRFYAQFDNEIKVWLDTMPLFGGLGEYYEMVDLFNKMLFN